MKTPFVGEMIMEEKEKLIVFFLSRIDSGVPPCHPLVVFVWADLKHRKSHPKMEWLHVLIHQC